MDDILTLLTPTSAKNEYGVIEEVLQAQEVFCRVESITRNEFFGAGRNGLNPQYRFTVFAADYDGQPICEYDGNTYFIYRTYVVSGTDYIELYVERRGGTNGATG